MLITESYREQNRLLHETRPDYGSGGGRWAEQVANLVAHAGPGSTVLDYGAGKQGLSDALPELAITSYDPAIAGIDQPPMPHDIVACCDVLEHIEPECIDAVLDHIASLARKYCFLVVNTQPAKKNLPDGRNAHILQRPIEWWMPKLLARWRLKEARGGDVGLMFMGVVRV